MTTEIKKLSPLHVAAYCAKAVQPEIVALETMKKWAEKNGIPFGTSGARIFGFNNPDPQPEKPEYGYEVWLEVPQDIQGEGEIVIKDFKGGLYACAEVKGVENIFPGWQNLLAWQEESGYEIGGEPVCLEEHLSGLSTPENEFKLRLYLPLKE